MIPAPPAGSKRSAVGALRPSRPNAAYITFGSFAAILMHVVLRYGVGASEFVSNLPLFATLVLGGAPLLFDLAARIGRGDVGSDLLAGISVVTAAFLGQDLAGALVVLMLAGGAALEGSAVERASSALRALAKRTPSIAHRRGDGRLHDIGLEEIVVGDTLENRDARTDQ